MAKGYIILREAFPDSFDPDSFWVCFSVLCLVALFMFGIQYSIYLWERRKKWKNSTSKKQKA